MLFLFCGVCIYVSYNLREEKNVEVKVKVSKWVDTVTYLTCFIKFGEIM